MENKITKVSAEEIKDSRRNSTIKVTAWAGDAFGSFAVPSGASTGIHEAHELRDADGRGVNTAITNVINIISQALQGKDVFNQREIDDILIKRDGTPNKDNLGGNAMIGASIACAKLAARISGQETFEYLRTLANIKPSKEIPYLYMNLINGGKHAKNDLAFQEYHIVPETEDAAEAVNIGIKIQHSLKEIIAEELGEKSLVLGDEGGFALQTSDIRRPLIFLSEAIKKNNLKDKVRLALDVAASAFYQDGKYKVEGRELAKEELMDIYDSLISEFKLLSIEDPFEEEDFESFQQLSESHPELLVVGDDLTVTSLSRLEKAIGDKSINAMIIKPNQIGTLMEMLQTMKLAREKKIELIVSHRSGETEDDFIADLSYAFGVFGLKAGSPIKPERMVKYQRLIEISKHNS